jgi:hypothetical protein
MTVGPETTKVSKSLNVAQLQDTLELILAGTVYAHKERDMRKIEFEQIQGAIQGGCSLFYYTDRLKKDKTYRYLHYFNLREWRIVQGMTINGILQDKTLTSGEREAMIGVDKDFFNKELTVIIKNKNDGAFRIIDRFQIIDRCRMLSAINGKYIWSFINRILVPPEMYERALKIAKDLDFPLDKIRCIRSRLSCGVMRKLIIKKCNNSSR